MVRPLIARFCITISNQDLNAILFIIPEKKRCNPRSGFMVLRSGTNAYLKRHPNFGAR
jgi:hypothetical protein